MEKTLGVIFKNEKSEFVSHGIVELGEDNKMVFYILSSKLASYRALKDSVVMEIHELLKGFGGYKDVEGVMGVHRFYIAEENWEKIGKYIKV